MDNYGNNYRPPQNWNGGQNSYLGNYQANAGNPSYGNFQQQPQPQMVQQTMIPGRLVNSLDDIVPGEVPMNGNLTYFPTFDQKYIHVLHWTREGKIVPETYIRHEPENSSQEPTTSNEEAFQTIMQRLDEMQKEIKRISRPRKRNQNFTQNRQGEDTPNV